MEQGAADESAGAAPQSIDSAAIDPEMGNDGEKFFAVAGCYGCDNRARSPRSLADPARS